jgi:undecaprenyl-diphosphatase
LGNAPAGRAGYCQRAMLSTGFVHDPFSTFQSVVLGLLQGVSELFPISSLGHTVLFPKLFGWNQIVAFQSKTSSPWLAFIVMLHVGSAVGLLIYFWRDWVKVIRAFFRTVAKRRIETPDERLAWLIISATIPVGILGLALQNPIREALAKPIAAAIFLVVNGVVLLGAERVRRRAATRELAVREGAKHDGGRQLKTLEYREAALIGVAQASALIPGISRDGMTMTGGIVRGLDNEDAAHFAFLLATPPILLAGILKLSELTGPLGAHGVRGSALLAAVCSAIAAVVTVHFLTRWFKSRNLVPFGVYCIVFGLAMVIYVH